MTSAPTGTGRDLVPWVPRRRRGGASLRVAGLVVLFGLAAGVGGAATYGMRHAWPVFGTDPALQAALRTTRDQVARLGAELKELKTAEAARTDKPDDVARTLTRSVDALKADLAAMRASAAVTATQATGRLDRLEHDARADKPAPEPAKDRTADLAARLDRLEKQALVATAAKPAPVAAEPARAAATAVEPPRPVPAGKATAPAVAAVTPAPVQVLPPPRPAATVAARSETTTVPASNPAPLRGWVLRDVYDGLAVVQARGGELREIGPGTYLPGAGEVRSIERHGRRWVVMTSRGVIEAAAF